MMLEEQEKLLEAHCTTIVLQHILLIKENLQVGGNFEYEKTFLYKTLVFIN